MWREGLARALLGLFRQKKDDGISRLVLDCRGSLLFQLLFHILYKETLDS
jgi:hypothetical protein